MMARIYLLLIAFLLSSCISEERKLENLFHDHWGYTLSINPLFATNQGEHMYNDRLPASNLAALERQYEIDKEFQYRLELIDRSSLSDEDQLNYDIFQVQIENSINAYERNHHLLPLNGWWDYHAVIADLPNRVPLNNVEDYENYISRLEQFADYNSGYIERMETGIAEGVVRPKAVFDDYLVSIETNIKEDIRESALFEPFNNFQERVGAEDRDRLIERAESVLESVVMPEFLRLRDFLRDEYIPNSADEIGISDIAGGQEYYRYLVEQFTTLDLSPDDIHQIGLEEVDRIRNEMMEIVEEAGFGNDFDGFVNFMRTDSQFYAETPEELMKETAFVLKKMDGKLPELFKTLPRLPYGIMEVPEHLAPRTATAYYSRGAADGTRAGFYAVNTYDLSSRPLYEVEALSLHEAVPGHHLQIALQQELEDLPKFRTVAGFTAYTEGWALYSERLGLEVGFYEDPYSNFGRLSYEMWRALRLVVDTGMHAKGWGRDEAIDFMTNNSALSLHNIRSEVNRYIFWPGQALAYKMGEIKIRELREMAEEEMGDEFDIREFHDVVLLSGSVPLRVLEDNVRSWIAK